jgi:hypothetical protein
MFWLYSVWGYCLEAFVLEASRALGIADDCVSWADSETWLLLFYSSCLLTCSGGIYSQVRVRYIITLAEAGFELVSRLQLGPSVSCVGPRTELRCKRLSRTWPTCILTGTDETNGNMTNVAMM